MREIHDVVVESALLGETPDIALFKFFEMVLNALIIW